MFTRILNLVIISSVVIYGQDEADLLLDPGHTHATEEATTAILSPPKNIQICTDLKPDFVSTRSDRYKTLKCTAKICNGADTDDDISESDNTIGFNKPIFDWGCRLGHILTANATCDYDRQYCWHSIDIDLRYFSDQMLFNGLNEIELSCTVNDTFVNDSGALIGSATATDFNFIKRFKGKAIDESCDNDLQCGDHMFCLNSRKIDGTVCQCSVDFLTGVQYVQVLDQKYNELICAPPLMINDSCLYDQQCQAMDSNSICAHSETDIIDDEDDKCQCAEGMAYYGSSCQTAVATEVTTKPTIIWWIFTNEYGGDSSRDDSSQRFWWLRTASYLMALLAIFVPILLILIAISILCYKRVLAKRAMSGQTIPRPKFPAPKIIINDFIKKEKSDDKYGLVKNDQLSGQ